MRFQVVTLPCERAGDVQRDLAAEFAEQQLVGAECGQHSVAGDGADADRPQPRGEAEEEDRRGDSRLCGTERGLDPFDDAVEQFGVAVELLHRMPAVVDGPGADGEIWVDVCEFGQGRRGVGRRCEPGGVGLNPADQLGQAAQRGRPLKPACAHGDSITITGA